MMFSYKLSVITINERSEFNIIISYSSFNPYLHYLNGCSHLDSKVIEAPRRIDFYPVHNPDIYRHTLAFLN